MIRHMMTVSAAVTAISIITPKQFRMISNKKDVVQMLGKYSRVPYPLTEILQGCGD
jgi:hypothetical protein